MSVRLLIGLATAAIAGYGLACWVLTRPPRLRLVPRDTDWRERMPVEVV